MKIARQLISGLRYRDARLEEMATAATVIAVPFNRYLRGERPDLSNQAIASIATMACAERKLPCIGQWEQTHLIRDAGIEVIEMPTRNGEWVQTHRLLRFAADQMIAARLPNRAIIVAHSDHMRRVIVLAHYCGLEPYPNPACRAIPYDNSDRPGAQWWCKTRARFLFWEYGLARPKLALEDILGRL